MTKIKIFIVDDHEVVRRGLAQFIEGQENLTVVGSAADATTAIAAMNDCLPDLAVVDLGLKGTSGIELIRAIRSRYPAVQILTLTMHSESEMIRRALQAGARGYVLKSEPVEQVVEAIGAIMAGKTYVSDSIRERLLDTIIQPSGSSDALLGTLTDREFDIFKLLGAGLDRREIARRLGINTSTIGTYRDRIKKKLNIESSSELVKFSIEWTLRGRDQE